MNKETLHIFYDPSLQKIKIQISSKDGLYLPTSAWQDILVSLMDNSSFKRTCSRDDLVVEYSDIVVKIDNWKECAKSPLVSRYIMKTVSKQQQARIQTVSKHNETVLASKKNVTVVTNSSDKELIPLAISKALKEKHDKAFNEFEQQALKKSQQVNNSSKKESLKVKRKNKYRIAVPLITGALVLSILSQPAMFKEDKNIVPEENIPVENVSVEPTGIPMSTNVMDINDNFQIGLDINDIVQPNFLVSNYSEDVNLKYEDRSEEDKAIETKVKYGDLIEKYAKKCGIDPKIVLGIATQESGNHELGLRSGSKGGLMQIEASYWQGKEVTYYDFDDKEYYVIKIDDNINNVENNILVGCALLQNELRIFNYNILLAIQSYNMGYSNMSKILDATSAQTGLTKTQIINDENCLDWLKYTNVVNQGDPNYVNNVLSWTGFGYSFYELSCQKESGDVKICTTLPIGPNNVKAVK